MDANLRFPQGFLIDRFAGGRPRSIGHRVLTDRWIVQAVRGNYVGSALSGSDAYYDLIARGGVNIDVHAELGDPAVSWMPCVIWVGTPQDWVE
ncbi:hypothetical protein A9W96_18890 [Mycobacterium sp. 1245852.3]|nr:hypothetical protein A9W96_18890 [Mycobacterium sp. 1245852.3]